MERTGKKWTTLAAAAALVVSRFAAAAAPGSVREEFAPRARAGEGRNVAVSVIPEPAEFELRDGYFAIRPGTRLSIPADPRAARVARYFSELLQQTLGIRVATGGSPATRPAYTISFKIGAREGQGASVEVPAMRFVDSPRFAWRGLLLDSARNA